MAKKKIYELDTHSSIVDTDVVAISAGASGNAEKSTAAAIKSYVKTGLTTADVAASTDKNYVTDAEKAVISATSGTNTWDQDLSPYEQKSNKKTSLTDNSDIYYPTQKAVKTAVDAKQDSLGYTAENVANKKTTITDSDTDYPTGKAVKTVTDAKQNTLVSGTNIKTVNGNSLLGSWNINIAWTGDVSWPASSTADHIPQFSDTTGKVLKDWLGVVTTIGSPWADTNIPTEQAVREAISIAGGGDVSWPASSTDSNVVMFNWTTGKLIKDSGVSLSGSNTGDETQSTIKAKLWAATSSVDWYATATQITKLDGIESWATSNTKATWAEVDTWTDDTKYVTPKAMKDSSYIKNPMTTSWDIMYWWVSWMPTRLWKWTDWQVLVLESWVPSWSDASWSWTSLWTAITGTRASNTTITVSGDQTAIFKKGMIVRWTESSVDKWGMVSIPSTYSSPNTTITIIGCTCASIDSGSFKYSSIIGVEQFQKNFALAGNIWATWTNVANTYYATEPMYVIGADLQVWTAGTTNSTTIVINKNWTTMFTTKPTLATTVASSPTPFTADTNTSLALWDKVTIDVYAVQTTAAQDLYVQLYVVPQRYFTLS